MPKLPTYYGIQRPNEGEITFSGLAIDERFPKVTNSCLFQFLPLSQPSYIAPRVPNIIPVGLCIFITSHISLLSNSWAWPKHAHNITNLVASLTSFFASTQLKNGQKYMKLWNLSHTQNLWRTHYQPKHLTQSLL